MRTVSLGGTDYALHSLCASAQPAATIIALHGFTGTGLDWKPVIEASEGPWQWICPDLPGHGQTRSPAIADHFRLERILALVEALRMENRTRPVHLVGYSMGGRIALHYLRRFAPLPTLVIGADPGIEATEARLDRARLDDNRISPGMRIEGFCQAWERLPLIASQCLVPEPLRSEISRRRRAQDITGLGMALRSLSPGRVPSLWSALPRMTPFVFVHGEQDRAYADVARRIQSANPACSSVEIPQAGHAVHLENPAALARLLREWIV